MGKGGVLAKPLLLMLLLQCFLPLGPGMGDTLYRFFSSILQVWGACIVYWWIDG